MLIGMREKSDITDIIVKTGVSRFRKDFCEAIATIYNKGIPEDEDLKDLAISWHNFKLCLKEHDLFAEIGLDVNDGTCTVSDLMAGEGIFRRSKDAIDFNVFGNSDANAYDYQALHHYNTMLEKRGNALSYILDILVKQDGELTDLNSFGKDELSNAVIMWVNAIFALKLWMIETFQVYLHIEGKILSSVAYRK